MKSIVVVGYEHTLAGGRALLEAGREAACRGADVSVIHAYHPGPAANNRDAATRQPRPRHSVPTYCATTTRA